MAIFGKVVKLRERERHGVDLGVTQRSFIDYRLSIIDVDFPMLYIKFG